MSFSSALVGAQAHRFHPYPEGGESNGALARVEVVVASDRLVPEAKDFLLGPLVQVVKPHPETGALVPQVDGRGDPVMVRDIPEQEARMLGHFACPDVEGLEDILLAAGVSLEDHYAAPPAVDAPL